MPGRKHNVISSPASWIDSAMRWQALDCLLCLKKLVKHEFSLREMLMRRILQEKNDG